MNELSVQIIIGLASVVALLLGLALARIWEEIRRLRSVRHADRDKIAELTHLVQGLKYELEDLRREVRSWVRRLVSLVKHEDGKDRD